ncbi:MAG: prolipoprotein diacylglyceryl transferase [Eubacteriales bacterium]|nr:prolipoprotein diacylglyceryl transferase [Eubacteriales bacterium]
MLPDFELFGKTIGTYGLCSIIGIVLCVCVATYAGKRYRLSFDDILLLTLSICGGLLLGGHLLYALTQQEQLRTVVQAIGKAPFQAILRTLASCFGGMVFYGGFLGGIAGAWLFGKYYRPLTSAIALDLYALVIPLFHAFGRIGCFLGGCCYGKPWQSGVQFPYNPLVPQLSEVPRFPVQLVEAGCNLVIFGVLLLLWSRRKTQEKLLFVYMLIYPPVRFTLEFFRGDSVRGFLWGLSTSQWISIILFCIALLYYMLRNIRRKQRTS